MSNEYLHGLASTREGIEPLREGITTSAVRGIPVTGLGRSPVIHDLDTVNWTELQDVLLD